MYKLLFIILIIIANFVNGENFFKETIFENIYIEDFFDNEVKIIGCFNENTLETREPYINKDGTIHCFWGGNGWKNIMLPPKQHLLYFSKYWDNEYQIINRLPIPNYESAFNQNKKGCHELGCDYGYLQIRDVYGGEELNTIEKQLGRLFNKEKYVLSENVCGRYWKEYNYNDGYNMGVDGVSACYYRYHNSPLYGHKYAKRAMITKEYYLNYFLQKNKNCSQYIKRYENFNGDKNSDIYKEIVSTIQNKCKKYKLK